MMKFEMTTTTMTKKMEIEMATAPSSTTEQREQKDASKPQTVIVDFDEPQPSVLSNAFARARAN